MVTTILFILSLVEDLRVVRPTLIVVHVGLLSSWEQELRLWAPKLNLVSYATKNEEARDVIRRVEFNLPGGPFKPDIVLTTFEVLNAVRIYASFMKLSIHVALLSKPEAPLIRACKLLTK
jgi:SNF2 family DNA or RNA helicase